MEESYAELREIPGDGAQESVPRSSSELELQEIPPPVLARKASIACINHHIRRIEIQRRDSTTSDTSTIITRQPGHVASSLMPSSSVLEKGVVDTSPDMTRNHCQTAEACYEVTCTITAHQVLHLPSRKCSTDARFNPLTRLPSGNLNPPLMVSWRHQQKPLFSMTLTSRKHPPPQVLKRTPMTNFKLKSPHFLNQYQPASA